MRVGSIFIPVTDLDRAVAWYQEHLQVNIIDRWEEGIGFYFPEGPTQFALIQVEGEPSTEFPMTKERKNVYFNFLTSDIEALQVKLRSHGVKTTELHDFSGMLCFDAYDLDGNVLSFVNEPTDSPYHSERIRKKQSEVTL